MLSTAQCATFIGFKISWKHAAQSQHYTLQYLPSLQITTGTPEYELEPHATSEYTPEYKAYKANPPATPEHKANPPVTPEYEAKIKGQSVPWITLIMLPPVLARSTKTFAMWKITRIGRGNTKKREHNSNPLQRHA